MTVQGLEALATDLLEYEDFVCFCIVVQDGSLNNGSFYIGSANLYGLTVCDEKHLGELYISTFGLGKPLHKDLITSLYFKLLACNVYDCVHQTNFFKRLGLERLPLRQPLTCSSVIKWTAKIVINL